MTLSSRRDSRLRWAAARSRRPGAHLLAVAAALGLGVPNAARAGTQELEWTSYVGVWVPTTDVARWRVANSFGDTVTVRSRHITDFATGGRLALWLSPRWGLEVSAFYSAGNLNRTADGSVFSLAPLGESDADLLAATARALLRVGAVDGPAQVHVAGGLGVIDHDGNAYRNVEGTTDLLLVLDAGLTLRLGRRLGLRFDLEDHLSWARQSPETSDRIRQGNSTSPTEPDADPQTRVQNDLVFSLGLAFPLTGGR